MNVATEIIASMLAILLLLLLLPCISLALMLGHESYYVCM